MLETRTVRRTEQLVTDAPEAEANEEAMRAKILAKMAADGLEPDTTQWETVRYYDMASNRSVRVMKATLYWLEPA